MADNPAIQLTMPVGYEEKDLIRKLPGKYAREGMRHVIVSKSLDARNKPQLKWVLRVEFVPQNYKFPPHESLVEKASRPVTATVVGSGPAGFFAAYYLQLAGLKVRLIEQGKQVEPRAKDIYKFESAGEFTPNGNYSFGEGGAGTFSDGKLTSRTKNIDAEREVFFRAYLDCGAPEEIAYLNLPHVGSDNLRKIAVLLRERFIAAGGEILFETKLIDLKRADGKVAGFETTAGLIESDYYIIASGHSDYSTFRMLIDSGITFDVKPFAIGSRVEHPQPFINKARWGREKIEGLKAADYKLALSLGERGSVYSFCMCPGGKVVQAAPREGVCVVNGMSYYQRNSPYANSAIVASLNLNDFLGKEVGAAEALDWLEALENRFWSYRGSFIAPAARLADFVEGKPSSYIPKNTYSHGVESADFRDFFPKRILNTLREGLKAFDKNIRGFVHEGVLIGLESKTSSPVRARRSESGTAAGFDNLYIVGEGSGYSGGIVSSAADGIRAAKTLIGKL